MTRRVAIALVLTCTSCVVNQRPVERPAKDAAVVLVGSAALPNPVDGLARHPWIALRGKGVSGCRHMSCECGIAVDLPAPSIGKDYRGLVVGVSTTAGGTGVQLETPVVGAKLVADAKSDSRAATVFGFGAGVRRETEDGRQRESCPDRHAPRT